MTKTKANEILGYVAQEILSPMAFDDRPASEIWSEMTGNQFHKLAKIVYEDIDKNKKYKDLARYGIILKDDNFDFSSEGIYVRMQVFEYEYENNKQKYLTICHNGECVYIEELKQNESSISTLLLIWSYYRTILQYRHIVQKYSINFVHFDY